MSDDGILIFNGELPRQKQAVSIANPDSIYCKWAFDIAENPRDYPLSSANKAKEAFETWGVELPPKLAAMFSAEK